MGSDRSRMTQYSFVCGAARSRLAVFWLRRNGGMNGRGDFAVVVLADGLLAVACRRSAKRARACTTSPSGSGCSRTRSSRDGPKRRALPLRRTRGDTRSVMSAPLVHLVTHDLELLDAAIDDPPALGRSRGCDVAEAWDVFPKALRLTRDAVVADPDLTPRWEGRGLPTAAVRELLCEAGAAPHVRTVLAPTFVEPRPSVRVLEKSGFVQSREAPDDEIGRDSPPPRPYASTLAAPLATWPRRWTPSPAPLGAAAS